jgi:cation:H+ antiporter
MTWGAESSQFFVAQGFALAILAWMQTLPEFAVEAVLAWHQQTTLLIANLTGAVRLLTGLAWPMIYATAAYVHRKRTGKPLRGIALDPQHSAEVIGLLGPLIYAFIIWGKKTLDVYDACVLVVLYAAYLILLTRLPPQEREAIEELDAVPRRIVLAPRRWRIAGISACFVGGGILIYFTAEPFLGSLIAVAGAIGIPTFIVIQWLAPVISEFPEIVSTFYFARQSENASIALMNIASSNINQWTLLMAMLPVAFSLSRGAVSAIPLDAEQQSQLLLTIAQSCVAVVFLANMELAWWEAASMFALFAAQFILPPLVGSRAELWVTYAFFLWTVAAIVEMIARRRCPEALKKFSEIWRANVMR